MKFFDDNTRSWWTPITGGANVPALNELLAPHAITLGERILLGTAKLAGKDVTVREAHKNRKQQLPSTRMTFAFG